MKSRRLLNGADRGRRHRDRGEVLHEQAEAQRERAAELESTYFSRLAGIVPECARPMERGTVGTGERITKSPAEQH